MKKILIYITFIMFITILLPSILVQVYKGNSDKNNKNININKEAMSIKDIDFKDTTKLKVYDVKTKKVIELGLEEYILGVISAEMPAAFHEEALKSQAVAARTYALSRMSRFKDGHPDHKGASLCTGIHCQAYIPKDELKSVHGEKWLVNYWAKLQNIVNNTKGEVMTYEGKLVEEPLFHSTSGGKTEDSEQVFASKYPYLKSVSSPFEEGSPKFNGTTQMSINHFLKKIKEKYPEVTLNKDNIGEKIKLADKSDTGRIKNISIDGNLIKGSTFRQMFGLNSTNFKIRFIGGKNIVIDTLGYGHGVGMSQWGANGMAKNGEKYKDILKHYYTGVKVESIER